MGTGARLVDEFLPDDDSSSEGEYRNDLLRAMENVKLGQATASDLMVIQLANGSFEYEESDIVSFFTGIKDQEF